MGRMDKVQEQGRKKKLCQGFHIIGSEVIGLTPAKALIDCAAYYLQLENFDDKKQVMENHLL
ncbi:MAG: hypothetical protein LBE16_00730 [Clostridiales Family XIII bacterium]|nr:hypothetical protein [Clostridiales Family XIII bacterium]